MAINFIPNQPVIFEKGYPDQPCQNNDNRAYAQLVSKGDNTCFQVQVTPCSDQSLCNPEMLNIGANIIDKDPGDWTETYGTAWGWSGSVLTYATVGSLMHTIASTYTVLVGGIYRLTLNITTLTKPLTVQFGLETRTITTTGTHVMYFNPIATPTTLSFTATGAGVIEIQTAAPYTFELVQMNNDCWLAMTEVASTAWTYSDNGIVGTYCSIAGVNGYLENTNAYANDNEYHRVRINISNCTTGRVRVDLGGTTLGFSPMAANGTYEFYGVPTSGNNLQILKRDGFDGCISAVDVYEYTMPSLRLLLNGSIVGVVKPPDTIVRDRAIWCIDWNNTYFETDLSCNYYSLQLFYACNEIDYDYKALSFFAYNPKSKI